MSLPRRSCCLAALLVLGVPSLLARAGDLPRPWPPAGPVVIAAAASLSDVMPRLAAARGPGATPISFRFDASSRLARQIEAGAPTDGFVSADLEWMEHLARAGRLVSGSSLDLAGNELVVVVPRDSRFSPTAASDLTGPQLERLALAADSVPAGRYARAALEALKVWPALRGRVVSGDTVRTALAWVARGEASAGIVYATDARVERRVRVALRLPLSSHPPIVYPAAVLQGALHADEARRFFEFCASRPGRAIFLEAGFLPPLSSPVGMPPGNPIGRAP